MTNFSRPVPNTSILGQRLLVIGNSCAGKSTLGTQLASVLNVPFVELDALNWDPNWVGLNDTNPDELMRRIQKATEGDRSLPGFKCENDENPFNSVESIDNG